MDACERYLNAIHELVDGTLGPIRRAELELHLGECESCRERVVWLRPAVDVLPASVEQLAPPETLRESLQRLFQERLKQPISARVEG